MKTNEKRPNKLFDNKILCYLFCFTGIHADDLSSINLNTVYSKSLSYQNAAALTNKKKKKRTGHKNRGYSPHPPNYAPPSLGPKFRRDYTSVDALMPSFAKTSISTPPPKVAPAKETSLQTNSDLRSEGSASSSESGRGTDVVAQESNNTGDSVGHTSGSEGVSATSSDSDFSDSEAGQAARLR
jgi:hypothetical protein